MPAPPRKLTRSSRVSLVAIAVSISGRSRSTVYSVLNGRIRSAPVELAIELAKEVLAVQQKAIQAAQDEFARQFPERNGNGTNNGSSSPSKR